MRRVVYVLGAGFSAPLGLPVMGNFLDMAKDYFYETEPEPPHFRQVLDTVLKLHIARSYYTTDVYNIEEILSILDMQDKLANQSHSDQFIRFIVDVIAHYTSQPEDVPEPNRYSDVLFGARPWSRYLQFASSLNGIGFTRTNAVPDFRDRRMYTPDPVEVRKYQYGIVSLNYDLVMEIASERLASHYGKGWLISRTAKAPRVPFVKLHGSVDTMDIVPPIWSKALGDPRIQGDWKGALEMLTAANEIRVIGYSLPDADGPVRYLLRAAAISAPNLKRIDVACVNGASGALGRWEAFVKFHNFRFRDISTESYLDTMQAQGDQWALRVNPDWLEAAHQQLFGRS